MRIDHFILLGLQKTYKNIFIATSKESMQRENNSNIVSQKLINLIKSDKPIMVARYGATELMCIINYLGVKSGRPNLISYIRNNKFDWWWDEKKLNQIEQWSGFFPATIENVERFCQLMINDSSQVDALASWLDNEKYLGKYLKKAYRFQGLFLDPFWSSTPWTVALKGQKVLVIHPFESAIKSQYNKREFLFSNPDILPEFELYTIKAVQSLGGECQYSSWFEALDAMKFEIDKIDFDVCLLGCGAYGFPLAAYIKQKGKKAIHMGGSLQLLFGIKGKRWENPMYGAKELEIEGKYPALMNEFWIYPGEEGKPKNASIVEGACYW